MEYSLREWYGKYLVVKTDPNGARLYLRGIAGSVLCWYHDPLYARPFTLRTALKHLMNLRAGQTD